MARASLPTSPLWGGLPPRPKSNNIIIITLFILLQLATFARAGVVFTNDEYVVRPGEPFTINWEGNRAPVTITLMRGPDVDLQPVMVIASGLSGNKYTWTPPQTLKTDGYELQIEDGVSTDYSPRFQYPAPPDPTTPLTPTTLATSTTVPSSPPTTTTDPSATTTSTPTSAAIAASETEGLSTGAKAGIAVGASVIGLALLAFLGWFIYNRGKKAGANGTTGNAMSEGGGGRGGGPAAGYYAPSGTGTFDQDTVIGSSVAGGYKSPWAGSNAARANTPFAELGQPEYMSPRELWAGGVYQGGPGAPATGDGTGMKGTVNAQERTYSVPSGLPIQHPAPTPSMGYGAPGPAPGYEHYDPMQQQADQIQQTQADPQQRIQDDWHAVVSPASRAGTGVSGVGGTGSALGGFDFGTSPVSVTSSPAPLGYSATVTAGGPPPLVPSTPPPGLGRYAGDASDGSPLSFAARVADEEEGYGSGQAHGRKGSRGQLRGGY